MTLAAQVTALGSMSTAELAAEYERLLGRRPRYRSVPWMRKRVAHALQVAAYGGLPRAAKAVLDKLIGEIQFPTTPTQASEAPTTVDARLRPGTVLTRIWHGRTVRVEIVEDGFVYDGERFTSLSAVARAVTGQRWSGALFFGLRPRSKR